jgi:hypothetical protein
MVKTKIVKKIIVFLGIMMIYPASLRAEVGGHANCDMCHIDVKQKNYQLVIRPDYSVINQFTGKAYGKDDALCMSCHRNFEAKTIHPVGIVPQSMVLPQEARGFAGQENEITCRSCHDPHPQNKNYKYLRWPADRGVNISKFCVVKCHSQFAKPEPVIRTSFNY